MRGTIWEYQNTVGWRMPKGHLDLDQGLTLSGGGFRATLFNLGGLWRLNELGFLKKLDIITSVSGGSITSGVLACNWKDLIFRDAVAVNFKEVVADPLRAFCKLYVDVPAVVLGLLSPWDSIPERVAKAYDKHLFHGATLQNLPHEERDKTDPDYAPRFVFYATNLQTGSSVRMSRRRLADYKLGEIPQPTLPLATAVAASSAFPPVLSPVVVKTDPQTWQWMNGAMLYDNPALRQAMYLVDGGVYDNMGLEAVWDRCRSVLVSDAGAPLSIEVDPPKDWVRLLMRVLNIITEQTRALRKRRLIKDFKTSPGQGAYWGIRTTIADYDVTEPLATDSATTASLARIRTRLNRFSDEEQGQLINWGYALADAALRKHVLTDAARGRLPFPAYPL